MASSSRSLALLHEFVAGSHGVDADTALALMISSCEVDGEASLATHMRMLFSNKNARIERPAKAFVVVGKAVSDWPKEADKEPAKPTWLMPAFDAFRTGASDT